MSSLFSSNIPSKTDIGTTKKKTMYRERLRLVLSCQLLVVGCWFFFTKQSFFYIFGNHKNPHFLLRNNTLEFVGPTTIDEIFQSRMFSIQCLYVFLNFSGWNFTSFITTSKAWFSNFRHFQEPLLRNFWFNYSSCSLKFQLYLHNLRLYQRFFF